MTARDKDILEYANGDPILIMEAFRFMLGEKIGEGESRAVYDYILDDRYVVKIAKKYPNNNINEYETWQLVKEAPNLSKWFAKVKVISPCGHIMLQRKTKPCNFLPDKLPNFFTDIKADNFGYIGTRFVCHDYAFTNRRLWYYHNIKMVSSKVRK